MPITSGVRQIRAWLRINGRDIPVISCEASISATRKSSSYSASFALHGMPSGVDEAYLATTTPITGTLLISVGQGPIQLITGDLDSIEADLATGLVHVSGRDKGADLHKKKSNEKFTNKKSSDIVQQIAQRVGLQAQVDSTVAKAGRFFQIDWSKLTDGISLAGLLHKIAEFEGASWWVTGATLHFKTDKSKAQPYVVNYVRPVSGRSARGDFMRLRIVRKPELSKTVKATVKSWNPKQKKVVTSTHQVPGNGGTTEYNYRIPGLTRDHADQRALKKLGDHARHELSINLEMVGDPALDPTTMKLRLQGTQYWDQDYDIDHVRHSLGTSGYRMTVDAKSAKKGRKTS